MVYKLGTLSDMDKLPLTDSKLKELIYANLKILDNNYGSNRDVDKDYGGYILYAEPGTKDSEVLSWFDYEQHIPEYVDHINSTPEYCCTLYLESTEYGVVIFTALDDTPKNGILII